MTPSTDVAPRPCVAASSYATMARLAHSTAFSDGAKLVLIVSICDG